MDDPRWNLGKAAHLDQMLAELGATLGEMVDMHRQTVTRAETRELAVIGTTAHLLELAEEEGERGAEWLAQLLAVAVNRLDQQQQT